jgi:hypothetical protein
MLAEALLTMLASSLLCMDDIKPSSLGGEVGVSLVAKEDTILIQGGASDVTKAALCRLSQSL